MGNNISHKVGIKILSDIQLENILPTYESLLSKIEVCREAAKNEPGELKGHYQYNFMYDNVFSILGQRGTGKTSVAFTLQRKIQDIKKDQYGDVVMPIIIPEIIPDNCTVLGWLLAIVGEEIEKLEEDILEYQNLSRYRRNEYSWDNNGFNRSELLEQLDKMNQWIHAGNYNPQNEKSYFRAVENSVLQAGDYYKFAKEIANLWDAWVKRIQEYMRLKENREVCPLIYFIFDDVDLAPEKIDEILSVIIKYLSHPNIIVLTTADEELFLEVIEKRLDKSIGRLPVEWRKYLNESREMNLPWRWEEREKIKRKDDLSYRTARRYLGKVLPASSRYYLRLFNSAKQKQAFRVEDYLSLGEEVAGQIQVLIDNVMIEEKPENFMIRNDEVIAFYLKFMGNTSRQIGNVYIAIKELTEALLTADRKNKRKESLVTVYDSISAFLYVAINSNHAISCEIEHVNSFIDDMFLLNYNQWKLYINYAYLVEFLENNLQEKEKNERIAIGLAMFSLFAFIENVLLIMEELLPGGITNRKKNHAVKFLSQFLQKEIYSIRYILRDDMPADEFFAHYQNLLERLESTVEDELINKKFNLEYFYGFKNYFYTNVVAKDLVEANRKDHIWFEELIGRLFLVYGNVYLINKDDIKKCCIQWKNPYHVGYQMVIDKEVMKNLNDIFSAIRMHQEWEGRKKDYESFFGSFSLQIKNGEGQQLANWVKKGISKELLFVGGNYDNKEDDEKAEKVKFVGLGNILKTYMEIMAEKKEQLSAVRFSNYIKESIAIIGEKGFEKSEIILRLINFYTGQLEYMDHIFNKRAIISNLYMVKAEIENIQDELPSFEFELDEILSELQKIEQGGTYNAILVEAYLYERLIRTLDEIKEWVDKVNYGEEEGNLKNRIRRIMSNMDIAVVYNNENEFQEALRLCDIICYLKKLQEIYIYSLVRERYEIGNSFSSVELEKFSDGTRVKDTYYYKFFEIACRFLEKTPTQKATRDYKETKNVIEKAYLRERQNYVKTLIVGEKY